MKIDFSSYVIKVVFNLTLILSFQIIAHSQSLKTMMSEARNPKLDLIKQIKNLEDLLDIPIFLTHQDTIDLLNYYIAFRYNKLANYEKVIEFSTNAIQGFKNANYTGYQYPTSVLMRAKSKLNLGLIDEAFIDFEYIINDAPIYGKGYRSLCEAYQKKSFIYRLQGDYESSIHNLNLLISTNSIDSTNRYGKASVYLELSIAHAKQEGRANLNLANKTIEKAIGVYEGVKITNDYELEQKVLSIMHQAFIKREIGDLDNSLQLYSDAINNLNERTSTAKLNNLATISMINISQILVERNSCEEALRINKKARDLFSQQSVPKYIETETELFLTTAESYLCRDNKSESQKYLQQAESLLLENEKAKYALDLRAYVYKDFLIKNKIRQLDVDYSFNQENTSINTLIPKTEFIDSLIGYYLEDMYFNSSKIELKNELDEFYKLALDISFESNDLDKFWYYSEKRSNLLLLEQESDSTVKDDPEYVELESTLKQVERRSADLENQIFSTKDTSDVQYIDSLENLLIKEKYEQLQLLAKRIKLGVYKPAAVTSFIKFRKNLEKNKCWINYQFATDNLYALMLAEDEVKLVNLGESSSIKLNLQNWFGSISQKLDENDDILELNSNSKKLYEALIKPLGKLPTNIIVIPDEELYYLSFDALQSSQGDYLIENHNVSYDLSSTFAYQHRLQKGNAIQAVSVFQPSYENTDYSELEFTSKDYESLVNAEGLTIYEKDQTTKHNFITSLEQSDIVHFGGHARHVDENNQYSHLALMSGDESINNMISLGDLYSIDIKSQLVALPACNTGMGSILQGEGISNLTRGFFYGGADAVISSLWEVDDKSTSKIINEFYKNLKTGQNKPESLRQAKLTYLSSVPDFQKHPNLWSGLILTGSDEAMNFGTFNFNQLFLWILGLVAFLILIIYLRYKK